MSGRPDRDVARVCPPPYDLTLLLPPALPGANPRRVPQPQHHDWRQRFAVRTFAEVRGESLLRLGEAGYHCTRCLSVVGEDGALRYTWDFGAGEGVAP